MAMTRRLMELTRDVRNPKPKRGTRHGLAAERTIPAETRFVHEIVKSRFTGEILSDMVVHVDDDYSPEAGYESGTPLYEALLPALKRVAPSPARILVELNIWCPGTLWEIFTFLGETGACDLEDIKKAAFAYRRSVDFDMEDEDDTVDIDAYRG